MRNVLLYIFVAAIIFVSGTSLSSQTAEDTGPIKIEYRLNPPADQIRPDAETARLEILLSRNGKPLDGRVRVILDSPASNPLVSTDFPIVEGTRLLDTSGLTGEGKFALTYLFPIRGEYTLKVVAQETDAPAGQTAPVESTFRFDVSENTNEVMNFLSLIAALVFSGFISGAVLGRGGKYRALLMASAILFTSGISAHDPAKHAKKKAILSMPGNEPRDYARIEQDEFNLSLKVVPGQAFHDVMNGRPTPEVVAAHAGNNAGNEKKTARVGDLAYLVANFTHRGRPVQDATYELTFYHIEDEKDVFKTTFREIHGGFVWGQQFFDGAEHRIILKATPSTGGKPVELNMVLGVEGIQPPGLSVFKSMVLLLGAMALGMVPGYVLSFRLTRDPNAPANSEPAPA